MSVSVFTRLLNKVLPRKVRLRRAGPRGGIGPTLDTYLTPEFAKLLNESGPHLHDLMELNESRWRFSRHKTWVYNESDGLFKFAFEDGVIVECTSQVIGSYSQTDSIWSWGWDDASFSAPLKQQAMLMRDLGRENNYVLLTMPKWKATMDDAWAMTAASAFVCQAAGAYCAEWGSLCMFFTFSELTLTKPDAVA